jgi:membrane protein YdbS with pleckstrin-like domain
MEFINQQVAEQELPRMEALVMKPLEPAYLRSLKIQVSIFFLIVIVGLVLALVFIPAMNNKVNLKVLLPLAWLVIFAGAWFSTVKSFYCKGFALREKDIVYRSGWLFQQTSACAFKRIQHCSVSSGPIDRQYGLATLRVFTAGAEGDLAIPGLPEAEAFAIKEFITQKIVNNEEPGN